MKRRADKARVAAANPAAFSLAAAPSVFGGGKKFNSFVDKSFFENDGKGKDFDSDDNSDEDR